MSDLISKEAVEVFLPEALFGAGCSVDQVDAAMKCVNSLVVVQNHTPDAPVPVEGLLRCEGCGNVTEDDARDLAWIRRHGGISCCPERKMVPIIPAAPAVKVKPLVWQERDEDTFWAAEGCGEMYYIRHYAGMRLPYCVDPSRLGGVGLLTIEAAKAVAQADYEARILSALEGGEA